MTYFEFLFSQLFMVKLEEYEHKLEYDEVFEDLLYFMKEYQDSDFSKQNKSEYDCINDYLRVTLPIYRMDKFR